MIPGIVAAQLLGVEDSGGGGGAFASIDLLLLDGLINTPEEDVQLMSLDGVVDIS